MLSKTNHYTPESLVLPATAIEKAKSVLEDDNATILEVEQAIKEVVEAYDVLEVANICDKSELHGLYQVLSKKDKVRYTDETWSDLNQTLKNTKQILENENATQIEVDYVLASLLQTKGAFITILHSDDKIVSVQGKFGDKVLLWANLFKQADTEAKLDAGFKEKYHLNFAYDLNILKDKVKQALNDKVLVSFDITNVEDKELAIIHMNERGEITFIDSFIKDDNTSFETDHFSIYALVSKKEVTPSVEEETKEPIKSEGVSTADTS